jgi:hypothetical protein
MSELGRQGSDMPNRLPTDHADHDLLLVAAHAAGDVTPAERTTAEALLATCPDCRELAADLRAIAAATATLPAPARTRDFTLRPQDAARLRPRGWRRLAAALGTGSLELTRPLAPVLMTLGVAGLLVSGLPLLGGFGSAGAAPALERTGAAAAAASAAPSVAQQLVPAAPAASAPAASGSRDAFGPAAAPSTSGSKALYGGAQASPSPISDTAGGGGYGETTETPAPEASVASPLAYEPPGPNLPLAVLSALALVAGLALFGLRRALRTTPGR